MPERAAYRANWRLIGVTATILVAGLALIIVSVPGTVEATRASIRFTARVSVVLFLAAFVASSLWQLWPGPFTRWLRANRRFIGLSFALSHFAHLAAILTFARLDPTQFAAETSPVAWILGGFAYVLITLMAATSFDGTARLIGPTNWKRLHTLGAYYIWLVFANSFISRALEMPEYIPGALAVVAALSLRIFTAFKRPGLDARAPSTTGA